jgi:guanylate kinase
MMTAEARDPLVFIVSGPSGSGKSTLVKKLLEMPGMLWSVSYTTRPPRSAERQGEWYNFISEHEFLQMVERGEFLEYARVFGRHLYGTPRRWLEEARTRGLDLVLEIDVQGADQVKEKLRDSIAIFILPPSRQELERRIRARGQDAEEEIDRRLERARQELLRYKEYDYVVVNDDVEHAGHEVQDIARVGRYRIRQNEALVQRILETFGG